MPGFEEYLINGDDLSAEQRDRMSQAVLGAVERDAVRFQTDIPELKPTDPPEVHAAAAVLRAAAGKTSEKDREYARTGWLDATDPGLWDAYVTFMPWSIDGDVWDRQRRQLVSVDDGVVTTVAVDPEQLPAIAAIVGADRLEPWLEVKAQRRAARRRWLYRHPDAVIGWVVVALGVLLIPLPGPGWLVVAAGALVLVAGALVRRIVSRHEG